MIVNGRQTDWKQRVHGSSFVGDGAKALIELDEVMKETLGEGRKR